jgi:hypothetical protein
MTTNVGFTAAFAAKCIAPDGRVVCFELLADSAATQIELASAYGENHTYQAVLDSLAGLAYEVRPVAARVDSSNGQFQTLASPRENQDAEALWSDLAPGRVVFE